MWSVLLVEDEQTIRNGMKVLLEEVIGGYKVIEASNGEEAFQKIKEKLPHVMITDIRMGTMDGLTLIRKVRQITSDLPIIIVSGYSDFEYARTALKYGVVDYLLKPIDRIELSALLDKLLKRETMEERDTSNTKQIRTIKQYIDDHLAEEITLKDISEVVYLHPQYISQLFKAELGISVTDYITNARIDRAKQLLRDTQLKVYEIARLCGYRTPKHFMNIFKQVVGDTPLNYRNKN